MPVPLTLGVPPHPDEHPLTARLLLPASGTVGITSPLVGALDADVVYVARPVDAEAVRELVGVGVVTGLDLTRGERSDGKFDARGERSDGKFDTRGERSDGKFDTRGERSDGKSTRGASEATGNSTPYRRKRWPTSSPYSPTQLRASSGGRGP